MTVKVFFFIVDKTIYRFGAVIFSYLYSTEQNPYETVFQQTLHFGHIHSLL